MIRAQHSPLGPLKNRFSRAASNWPPDEARRSPEATIRRRVVLSAIMASSDCMSFVLSVLNDRTGPFWSRPRTSVGVPGVLNARLHFRPETRSARVPRTGWYLSRSSFRRLVSSSAGSSRPLFAGGSAASFGLLRTSIMPLPPSLAKLIAVRPVSG